MWCDTMHMTSCHITSHGCSPTGSPAMSACSCMSSELTVMPPSTCRVDTEVPESLLIASKIWDNTNTERQHLRTGCKVITSPFPHPAFPLLLPPPSLPLHFTPSPPLPPLPSLPPFPPPWSGSRQTPRLPVRCGTDQ